MPAIWPLEVANTLLMGERRKSRIVCIDDLGALQGVISLSDIAQNESDKRAAETMRRITEREVYRAS